MNMKKPKTENSVLLPVPLAPTNTQKWGMSRRVTSLNARKFFSLIDSICIASSENRAYQWIQLSVVLTSGIDRNKAPC